MAMHIQLTLLGLIVSGLVNNGLSIENPRIHIAPQPLAAKAVCTMAGTFSILVPLLGSTDDAGFSPNINQFRSLGSTRNSPSTMSSGEPDERAD